MQCKKLKCQIIILLTLALSLNARMYFVEQVEFNDSVYGLYQDDEGVLFYKLGQKYLPETGPESFFKSVLKEAYFEREGYTDLALVEHFLQADSSGDGVLQWRELQQWLDKLYRNYSYFHNQVVYDPLTFRRQGGGDCDDWTVYIAEFLFFWNHKAYFGAFVNSSPMGHAMTLIELPEDPRVYMRYNRIILGNKKYMIIDYNALNVFAEDYVLDDILPHREAIGKPW